MAKPVLHTLSSCALTQPDAHRLMAALEKAGDPTASAVSMNQVDEAQELWQVVAYYETPPNEGNRAQLLSEIGLATDTLSVAPLPEKDWVAASLEGLAPVIAGRFFIYGEHHKIRRPGGISLHIEAGTAFGTGHHSSTHGCLMALDSILKARRPYRVLDIGCGTGILAIAAARTARCGTFATDIDPEATRVSAANVRHNAAGPLVHVITASGTQNARIAHQAPYDLIFANILARPLILLSHSIKSLAAINGDIVLSGLTVGQESWVLAAYRNRNFTLHRRIRLDDWSTLWLRRR